MDDALKQLIRDSFGDSSAKITTLLFTTDLSPNGRAEVEKVITEAARAHKPGHDLYVTLEQQANRYWCQQSPDVSGDPNAPGPIGEDNRNALWQIYNVLRLPMPKFLLEM